MQVTSSPVAYRPRVQTMKRPSTPIQAGGGTAATPSSTTMAPMSGSLLGMSYLIGNDVDLAGLNRWGLASPGMLRFAAGGGIRRAIFSFLTGIPTQRLLTYGMMADLMRVPGMDPCSAHLLVLSGIYSPMDLSRYAGTGTIAKIQQGIVWAGLAAQATNSVLSGGLTYQVPTMDQLGAFAQASVGMSSSISYSQSDLPPQSSTLPLSSVLPG